MENTTPTEQQRQGLIRLLQQEKKKHLIEAQRDYTRRFDSAKASFLNALSRSESGSGFAKRAAGIFGNRDRGPVFDEEIDIALETFENRADEIGKHFDQGVLDVLTAPTIEEARQAVESYL
ncbi:MAG TPA: hypothetical protein VKU01_20755 [Bryobacteraceae bacterium]|nr:hypothetical protein [Bryobacteraceae bacterium]